MGYYLDIIGIICKVPNYVLRTNLEEPSKQKMSQIVEKGHNFLDPPYPQDNLDFFEFGKKLIFDDPPPPRPKLGKIWNVDYFDIVAPRDPC